MCPYQGRAIARRRKVRNEYQHEIRIITMRMVRWVKHMAYMESKENAYILDFSGEI